MGTSQSSNGSPSSVPMVPPWVPDPVLQSGDQGDPYDDNSGDQDSSPSGDGDGSQGLPSSPPVFTPIAPARRFGGARTNLNSYAKTGANADMRRSVGQYIKKGYGGGDTAVRRFGGTVTTAGALYSALSGMSAGGVSSQGGSLDTAILSGKSAQEVIDAVIEAASPIDGTQDTEANRASIHDALSELLERHEDADLLDLSENERAFVIERYVARDIFRRFDLDLGQTISKNAPSVASALSRLKEIREYIRETVSSSFRKLKDSGQSLTSQNIRSSVDKALREAFGVFEDYAL